MKAGAFLDRDGVVNIDHGYVCRQADFEFVPGTLGAARRLKELGFALVVVTNQSGIARGYYTVEQYDALTAWMESEFDAHGAALDAVYYCPHHPSDGVPPFRTECSCRKPAPGMILDAARDLDIDLARSVLFGDKPSDMEAAAAAGIPHRVLLGTDGLQMPRERPEDGLVTARHASLAAAVESLDELLARLPRQATP